MLRQIAKRALDAVVAENRKAEPLTDEGLYRRLAYNLSFMAAKWRDRRHRIPYDNPWFRAAFVLAHVAPNADATWWLLHSLFGPLGDFVLERLNATGRVRVAAVGGGPGTELLGLGRFLAAAEQGVGAEQPLVEFTALDHEAGWAGVFGPLAAELRGHFAADPSLARFEFQTRFVDTRLPAPDGYGPLLEGCDLYLVNYVFSELWSDEQRAQFTEFLRPVVDAAPTDAVFVAIDMFASGSDAPRRTRDVFERLGVRKVRMGADRGRLPGTESASVMDPYAAGLERHHWSLREDWSVFWFVGTRAAAEPGHAVLERD